MISSLPLIQQRVGEIPPLSTAMDALEEVHGLRSCADRIQDVYDLHPGTNLPVSSRAALRVLLIDAGAASLRLLHYLDNASNGGRS